MAKHVYEVEINGAYRAYVAADNATKAKSSALKHVAVRRLDAGEIMDLMDRGIGFDKVGDDSSDGEQA